METLITIAIVAVALGFCGRSAFRFFSARQPVSTCGACRCGAGAGCCQSSPDHGHRSADPFHKDPRNSE